MLPIPVFEKKSIIPTSFSRTLLPFTGPHFSNLLLSVSTNKLAIQVFFSSWLPDRLSPFSSISLTAKLLGMVLYTASHTGILAGYLRNPDDSGRI